MAVHVSKKVKDFGKSLLPRHQWLGILITTLIIAVGITVAQRQLVKQAGVIPPGTSPYLSWQVTDHDTTDNPLKNDLSNTQTPEYNPQIIQLNRDASGNITSLLRFQGELRYISQ